MSDPIPPTPEESIRRAHLSHEASIQSIGLLYFLAAVLLPVSAIISLIDPKTVNPTRWPIAILLIVMSVVYFVVGRWFRALNPKAKVPGTLLAAIGLLAFPVGTLINIYILYLINSKKGALVFSEPYRAVIAATPTIKYKTPLLVWIFLGLLVFLLIVAFAAATFGAKR